MKRKLDGSDAHSRAERTATTASLSFESQSQNFPQQPTQESSCQVAFCEQTAREMTELVNYWQAVQSAQNELSPIPSAPVGNSLFAWSDNDDDDDSVTSVNNNLYRVLFPEDEEEGIEKHARSESTVRQTGLASEFNECINEEPIGPMKSPLPRNLQCDLSPVSRDETSSLPSEIHIAPNDDSPCFSNSKDWSDRKANKTIVQNMHVVSQQQSKQVDQLTECTAELEQQVHATLMSSPLFQRYNRRSLFTKQRQEILQAIDVALDQPSSPIISSSPRGWENRFNLWLRYEWHRLEDKLLVGLWEWIPLEWLSVYYYLWAKQSAHTRKMFFLITALIIMILFYGFSSRSTTRTSTLVHFPEEHISTTTFPEPEPPLCRDWLL